MNTILLIPSVRKERVAQDHHNFITRLIVLLVLVKIDIYLLLRLQGIPKSKDAQPTMQVRKLVVSRDEICFVLRDIVNQLRIRPPCPMSFYCWTQKIVKGNPDGSFPVSVSIHKWPPVDKR